MITNKYYSLAFLGYSVHNLDMFRTNERWRHRNCLDIDIIIQKVIYRDIDRMKLKVLYWNRHGGYLILPKADNIEIKTQDFKNWSLVQE